MTLTTPALSSFAPILCDPKVDPKKKPLPQDLRERITEAALTALQAKERSRPLNAEDDKDLELASKLIKLAGKESDVRLHTELLACKLGIPTRSLEENPDFALFAKKAHLERYLTFYGDTLRTEGGRLQIKHQGVYRPWSEVASLSQREIPAYPGQPELYNPGWYYGPEGLQARSLYEWTTLEPFKKERPTWGNTHVLELCMQSMPTFRWRGEHTWIRLKTPEGEVYSVGLYRENNNMDLACETKRSALQSPDVSEFWNEPIHTLSFEITEEQFGAIKEKVEIDHQAANLPFHLIGSNCSKYAVSLAKVADIEVPSKLCMVRLFIPTAIQRIAQRCYRALPSMLKPLALLVWKVVRYPLTILANLYQWKLGGSLLSKGWEGANSAPKPHFRALFEVLNPSKCEMDAPYRLAHEVRGVLAEARQKEGLSGAATPRSFRSPTAPQYQA